MISPTKKSLKDADKVEYHDRLLPEKTSTASALLSPRKPFQDEHKDNELYNILLKSELLESNEVIEKQQTHPTSPIKSPTKSLFSYRSPTKHQKTFQETSSHSKYQEFKMSSLTMKLLTSPRKAPKPVAKTPFKVLDAPELQDDFYLNLVDWGSSNILGVGLGSCVYLWNAVNSEVTKMCDLGLSDSVTSLSWNQKGNYLAVGTNKGLVQLWDVQKSKRVRTLEGHQERVGTSAWNSDNILSSGSRDRSILHWDLRCAEDPVKSSMCHLQEVCGLKWNTSSNLLASGGNDNKLLVWDWRKDQPIHKFTDHVAAVKAISWSTSQSNILASGGGTADRTIRFWNTGLSNNNMLRCIDTGSQVCNIAWSKTGTELVSTHGYSQNQINIWNYKNMEISTTLTGHSYRVLYLASSPDGQNIVTGAGDETLRFWNVFSKTQSKLDLSSPMYISQMR